MQNDNFSWTRLNTLGECELKHYLQYDQHIKGVDRQSLYITGRVVHKVIKTWSRAGFDDTQLRNFLQAALRAERNRLALLSRDKASLVVQRSTLAMHITVGAYRNMGFVEHGALVEENFSMMDPGGMPLNGSPDVYDPVTKTILDLKTQRTGRAKPEQLYHYAWAEQLLGREVKKGIFLYPLQTRGQEEIEITQELIDAWKVEAYARRSRREGSTPTRGDHCTFCGYYKTKDCPATFRQASIGFLNDASEGFTGETSGSRDGEDGSEDEVGNGSTDI